MTRTHPHPLVQLVSWSFCLRENLDSSRGSKLEKPHCDPSISQQSTTSSASSVWEKVFGRFWICSIAMATWAPGPSTVSASRMGCSSELASDTLSTRAFKWFGTFSILGLMWITCSIFLGSGPTMVDLKDPSRNKWQPIDNLLIHQLTNHFFFRFSEVHWRLRFYRSISSPRFLVSPFLSSNHSILSWLHHPPDLAYQLLNRQYSQYISILMKKSTRGYRRYDLYIYIYIFVSYRVNQI